TYDSIVSPSVMLPVFRAKKRATQNANQEVARVATALPATPKRREGGCRLLVGQFEAQTPHRGVATGSRKQSFVQRNAPRKMRCCRLMRRKICTAILNVARVPFSDAPLI